MPRRIIKISECDSPEECCKLFQQLFDNQADADEYNAEVEEYNGDEIQKGGD
jgi:hypothetical protein